jgi:hypothetical protein
MAEQEALFPIRSLISHILTFLVSFVFASFPLLLPGFTLLVLNYLEKFQIPSISESNKSIFIKTGQRYLP